jgi:hypothetical protein
MVAQNPYDASRSPLIGPKLKGYTIGSWCPTLDGSGPPEAVALTINVQGMGDLVLRLKSKRAVDEMIELLQQYKEDVWPTKIQDGQHQHGNKDE